MSFRNRIPTLSVLCRRLLFVEAVRNGNATELSRLVKEDPSLVNAIFPENAELERNESALDIACCYNQLEIAKLLLRLCADVEGTCELTPLMVACEKGLLPFVKLLLDNGSNVNATVNDYIEQHYGKSALHFACSGDQLDVVKLLLDCKADLEARDNYENTPFLSASLHGRLEIMKHLANIGCNMRATGAIEPWIEKASAFHFACLSGHLESVLWLTSCGFDIKEKDGDQRTGLHLACIEGHLPVAELLLGRGLHIDLPGENGLTPFLCAALSGSVRLLKWLKEKGCNIRAKDEREYNALHYACEWSNEEAAEYLIKHCTDINELQKNERTIKSDSETCINLEDENEEGKTALMLASGSELLSIVKLLVARNCDCHHKDERGRTALFYCYDSVEIVEFLLSCGLTVDEEDNNGETIFQAAIEWDNLEVAQMLLTKYRDINQKGRDSWERLLFRACQTGSSRMAHSLINEFLAEIPRNEVEELEEDPLCEACERGLSSVVKCLAEKGWPVNRRDRRGSPLEIACFNNHDDIVHFLIDFGVDFESKNECMRFACSIGNVPVVRHLIENGCSPKERLEEGRSWLHTACVCGKPEIALFLIDAGVVIREEDNDGMTLFLFLAACKWAWKSPNGDLKFVPVVERYLSKFCILERKDEKQRSLLHIACAYRLVHVAHLLIDSGISLNEVDNNGQTPVMIACENGLLSVVQSLFNRQRFQEQNPKVLFLLAGECECVDVMLFLFDYQMDSEQDCLRYLLWTACKIGHLSAVKHLAEKEDFILNKSFRLPNLLHVACKEQRVDVAIFLISCGVDLNRIDEDGNTPVEIACEKGLLPVVRALASKGCSLLTRTKDGNNLLHIACSARRVDVATFLIDVGISLDEQNDTGEIPLEIACRFGLLAVVRKHVEKAYFVKENSKDANRLLHVALKEREVTIANMLIDAGVNIGEKDDSGRTAIAIACEMGIYCIVERLANLGSCLKNECLLHLACTNGHYLVVEFLITSGVDVNERNSDGVTPLMIACGGCYFAIARLLMDSGSCIDAKDLIGRTGLHLCCVGYLQFDYSHRRDFSLSLFSTNEGDVEFFSTIDALTESGSNLNAVDQFGVTPFIYVMNCHPEFVNDDQAIRIVKAATKIVSAGAIIDLKSETLRNGALHLLTKAYSHWKSQLLKPDIQQLAKDFLSHGANPVSQNSEGKFPYELVEGQLRLILRKAFQEKRFSELSVVGVVSPKRIKVCLIGEPKAGKTTLLKSLQRKRSGISIEMLLDPSNQSEPRTIGIEIVVVNIDGIGELFFMDFAGQEHFHKTHSLFFSGSTTIYLLVMDLRKTDPVLCKEASYWLSLVKCSVNPSGSRVLLIGSRGEIRSDEALRRLRKLLNRKFQPAFLVCDEVFALDCRSNKMDKLKTQLLNLKITCIESADKVPVIVENVTASFLFKLRRFMKEMKGRHSFDDLRRKGLLGKDSTEYILTDHNLSEEQVLSGNGSCYMSRDLFCLLIEQNVYPGLTEPTLSLLMEHLHGTGEIFEIESRVIFDPAWLCHAVIGPLLSADENPIYMEGVIDGQASADQIMQVIEEFNPGCHFSFKEIVMILSHMEVCFPVFGKDDVYQFPGLICEQQRQEMWLADANKEVYVGRRIQCEDETDIIIPGAIPFLQTRSAVRIDPQLLIWKDGMILRIEKEDCTLQCLIELQERAKAIDIVVRGLRYSEAECLACVEEMVDLTLKVLDDKSPGTAVLSLYLSTSEIKKHADDPPAYEKYNVQSSARSVSVKAGLRVFSDSVRDLLVVPKNHYVLLPMTVKKYLVEAINGRKKAGDLGRALGLSCGNVAFCGNSSHDILTKWSENLNATVPELAKGLKEANCRVGLRLLREAATGGKCEAAASFFVSEQPAEDMETIDAGSSTAEDSVSVETINRPVFQSDVGTAIVGSTFNDCTINTPVQLTAPSRGLSRNASPLSTSHPPSNTIRDATTLENGQPFLWRFLCRRGVLLSALTVIVCAVILGAFCQPSTPSSTLIDWKQIGELKVTDDHIKAISLAAQKKWKIFAIHLQFGTNKFNDYERQGSDFLSLYILLSDWKASQYSPKLSQLLKVCKEAEVAGNCKKEIENTLTEKYL